MTDKCGIVGCEKPGDVIISENDEDGTPVYQVGYCYRHAQMIYGIKAVWEDEATDEVSG